jgi:transposase
VDAPVQYGPRITAVILYLYVGQFLSKARTAAALAELFGTPVATGTVAAVTARAAGNLEGFLELVRGQIAAADAAHFDETGLRVAGTLHWVFGVEGGQRAVGGECGIDESVHFVRCEEFCGAWWCDRFRPVSA